MSRSRFAIWNYTSAWLFTAVTLIGLVTTRYVVNWLGEDRFGAYRMLTDWLGYLGLFELGLTGALSPLLARSLAEKDREKSTKTLTVGLQAFFVLGTITLITAIGMWLAITRLVPVDPNRQGDLRLAWGISLISLLPMALAPFRALAEAGQRGYRINFALTLQSLMVFGLSLLFARIGWGISGQALATTMATLPLVLILTYEGFALERGLFWAALTRRPDPLICQALLALAVPTFLICLSGRISVLTDSLVVGNLLGTSLAARLVLTQKLAVMAQGQLQGIGAASWAGLVELHSQGKRDDFNRRLIELTGVLALLAMAGLAPIIAYNHHFISLWVGPERNAGDAVVLISSINALFLGLTSLWFWCFTGTGQARKMVPITLTGACVNLSASILLTYWLGIIGPLLGSLLTFVSISLWVLPLQLRRSFGTPVTELSKAWMIPLMWGVPYATLLWWMAQHHRPWGWVGLALEMSLSALIFLILGGFFILKPESRAIWASRLVDALPWLRSKAPAKPTGSV